MGFLLHPRLERDPRRMRQGRIAKRYSGAGRIRESGAGSAWAGRERHARRIGRAGAERAGHRHQGAIAGGSSRNTASDQSGRPFPFWRGRCLVPQQRGYCCRSIRAATTTHTRFARLARRIAGSAASYVVDRAGRPATATTPTITTPVSNALQNDLSQLKTPRASYEGDAGALCFQRPCCRWHDPWQSQRGPSSAAFFPLVFVRPAPDRVFPGMSTSLNFRFRLQKPASR